MIIYCDGSYRPALQQGNVGFAAWTAWEGNREVARWNGRVEASDPVQTEFLAIYHALLWAIKKGIKNIKILSDSQIVVYHLLGRMKSRKYRKLCNRVLAQAEFSKGKYSFFWIPRDKNLADKLCREKFIEFKSKAA